MPNISRFTSPTSCPLRLFMIVDVIKTVAWSAVVHQYTIVQYIVRIVVKTNTAFPSIASMANYFKIFTMFENESGCIHYVLFSIWNDCLNKTEIADFFYFVLFFSYVIWRETTFLPVVHIECTHKIVNNFVVTHTLIIAGHLEWMCSERTHLTQTEYGFEIT